MSLIKLELPSTAYPEVAEWSMGKFSEIPKFILEDFFGQSVKLATTNNNNRMIVIGGETTIVCYDVYNVMYLWVEKDISTLDEDEIPNLIASTHGVQFEEDSKILIPIPFYSPDYFLHNNFFMLVRNVELETAATSGLVIDSNSKIYFRSDGAFHDFIRNRSEDSGSNDYGIPYTDYDQFVNINKTWLYFGKIYSSSVDKIFWVEYKGIDRFSVAALPPVNRTPKIESMFELFFDRVYNQAYNLERNLHSLIDPWEIDMTFIEYLASHYSMTLEHDLSDDVKRQYVYNLINLLKRKGTYASLFIVFKSLFPASDNNLIVYERWHERGLTGSPLLHFKDFNYLQSYTYTPSGCAGTGFYNTISQGGWDIPLNEMCHIHQQHEYQNRWVIPHKLNTRNPLIAVYDDRLRSISPKMISNPESYLTVLEFDSYVKGFCLMTYPQQTLTYETSANSWEFAHTLGQLTPVIQNYDSVDFSMIDLKTVSPQTSAMTILQSSVLPDEVVTVAVSGDYVFVQEEPISVWEIEHTLDTTALVVDFYVSFAAATWTIHHNLNTTNLIIQCFDNNYNNIKPDQVKIVSSSVIEISFESKQEGFALIKIADYSQNIPSGTSFDINHNLEVFTPMIQAFNESGQETVMNRLSVTDKDNVAVETWEEREFDFKVVNPSYIQKISNKTSSWNIRHEIGNRELIVQTWVNEVSEQWEIPHEFGHRNLFYQCFSGDGQLIYPKEARIYDDKIVFLFTGETDGYVCLTEASEIWVMDYSDLWVINHTLDHLRAFDVVMQTVEVSGDYNVHIVPDEIWLENNGNTINASFSEAISGLAYLKVSNYYSHHSSRSEWLIHHYLDEDGLITKCFTVSGDGWQEIIPDEVEMISSDVTKIIWSTPTSGFVVFTIPDDILMPIAQAAPNTLRLIDEDYLTIDWYTAQRGYVVITEADAILRNFNKATPKSLKIDDASNITVDFDIPLTGYAVLHDVGQLVYSAPLMMSPHYICQLDISCEPFNDNWILDEASISQLIKTWEISKPVSRFSHYSILVSPITDWDYESDFFTAHWHRMYPLGSNVNLYTKACLQTLTVNPSADFVYTNYSGGTLWDISHTLNTDNLSIQCYDENGYMIWPDEIQILSNSRVLITFTVEQRGSAFLCIADFVESILTEEASGAWYIDHRLGEKLVLAQHYYKNIADVENEVRAYLDTWAIAYFNETTYDGLALGKETVIGGPAITNSDIFTGAYSGTTWNVNHNLGTRGVLVAVFGSDYYQIIPNEIHLTDDENLTITFSESTSGYIIVKSVGGLLSQQGVIDSINTGGYIKIGNGTILASYNPKLTGDLKSVQSQTITPLTISEDSNYYYITGEVMLDNLEFDVTEIGLFSNEDELIFYSMINAELFKPSNVDFAVHYRISKTSITQ